MAGFLDIALLFAFIAAGYLLSKLVLGPVSAPRPFARRFVRLTDLLLKASLYGLLLVMGYRLGSDVDIRARLPDLGLLALVSALLAVVGTVLCLLACDPVLRRRRTAVTAKEDATAKADVAGDASATHKAGGHGDRQEAKARLWRQFRGPLLLFLAVLAGFALGVLVPRPAGLDLDALSSWALKILLFFIGMQFAQAGISIRESLLKPAVLVVPLATALGSVLSGLALMPLFGLPLGKALALQAGFGWYSLSGILIAGLGDPGLGSVSFLSNMAREALAFALIPFLARTSRPWLGIGIGGATAMDVTLPIVEQCAGPQWVPSSFASGATLSLLVPLLVPALFGL